DTDSDLVLDVDGNPLEVGSEYYIGRAVGFYVVERFSSDVQIDSGLCRSDGFWRVSLDAYSPPTTTSSQQQRYLTVFRDRLSGLKLVGLTDDSDRVVL
uniref:Kunitz-type trypsin inhibitor 1 (Fragments) n=1 Tax=Selenicereus costaricensis TaxID=1125938 RepID=KTI1_SELCO|nr:RecName: Full=Kunitz-type trypsin inhibitor 1 [Selenicereus costaricensis]